MGGVSRAHALHRQWQRAAAAGRSRREGGSGRPQWRTRRCGGRGRACHRGPLRPLAWQGERGLGIDDTNTASKETRRAAALAHDEDWFISFANRIFEL